MNKLKPFILAVSLSVLTFATSGCSAVIIKPFTDTDSSKSPEYTSDIEYSIDISSSFDETESSDVEEISSEDMTSKAPETTEPITESSEAEELSSETSETEDIPTKTPETDDIPAKNPETEDIPAKNPETTEPIAESSQSEELSSETHKEELTEEALMEIVSTFGIIGVWHYDDYDGNGKNEAFAVIIDKDEENYRLINFVIFIDGLGDCRVMCDNLDWCVYLNSNGYCLEHEGKKFFNFNMGAYGSGFHTCVFSVKDNLPYELDISQNIQGFYKNEDGVVYTTKNEFLPSGGHKYPEYELVYNSRNQQFSEGRRISE